MDPALKAGLPKLFVLEGGQTAATRTQTRCRGRDEGKNMEHFIERVQIRKANCNSAEEKKEKKNGANIAELRAKRKTLTQHSGDHRQKTNKKNNRWRKQRRVGSEAGHVWAHSSTFCFSGRCKIVMINGFSHSRGITRHVPATFFPICRHRSRPDPGSGGGWVVIEGVGMGVCPHPRRGSRQTVNTVLSQRLTGRSSAALKLLLMHTSLRKPRRNSLIAYDKRHSEHSTSAGPHRRVQ